MNIRYFFIAAILLPQFAFGQIIKGTVTNYEKEPVPFATIYIEELQTGTSANQQGNYEIHVVPGNYTLTFRSMGYSPQVQVVEITNADIVINVELFIQSYILEGVTVRADAEDPAYSVMRKAIARTPVFINQIKSYTSKVYIKGSVKATKIPKIIQNKMEVNGEKPQVGVTYINESINRIRFQAPDKYTQEVISVNNSFPMGDDDVPVIEMISGSIYESQDDFYISPFAPNAFSHYNFKYEGLLQDGEWFIDKIKVTPKRKSKLLMEGWLYIVEDLWCLYSYDIVLNPAFIELKMKQHYAPVKGNCYLPVNLFVDANIGVMGIKAKGTYTTSIKYDSVILNPNFNKQKVAKTIDYAAIAPPAEGKDPVVAPEVEEIDKKLDELYKKSEPTNREMVEMQKLMAKKADILEESGRDNPLQITSSYQQIVPKEALVRDSIYWDSVRPVPVSSEEKYSYKKREEEQQKIDSTSTFVKALKIAAFGNYEWERSKKFYVHYAGLFSLKNIGFNPVDGLQIKQYVKMRLKIDSTQFIEMKITPGYAWSRESFFGKANIWHKYNYLKDGWWSLDAGWLATDFNENDGTPENVSALYNLFLKESYIQFYQNKYLELNHRIDIANGLGWFVGGKWAQTDSLSNSTDFSFFYPDSAYKANIPNNSEITAQNLAATQLFSLTMGFQYTPKYYYQISNGRKRYIKSKWPTFGLFHTAAIPLNTGDSKFHHTRAFITQNIDFYGVSSISYRVAGGLFYDTQNMHFSEYNHFKTIDEPFTTRSFKEGYFLLNNYEYSTANSYMNGFFRYNSQYLLLKRLPWVSNQLWTENLFANVLWVKNHDPYVEFGYSLDQIFFGGQIGVFAGIKGTEFHGVGVKATFEFK